MVRTAARTPREPGLQRWFMLLPTGRKVGLALVLLGASVAAIWLALPSASSQPLTPHAISQGDYEKIVRDTEARVKAELHEPALQDAHTRAERAERDVESLEQRLQDVLQSQRQDSITESEVDLLKAQIAGMTADLANLRAAERDSQLGRATPMSPGMPVQPKNTTGPIGPEPPVAGVRGAGFGFSAEDTAIRSAVQAQLAQATASRVEQGARRSLGWFCGAMSGKSTLSSAIPGTSQAVEPAPWFGQVPASVASPSTSSGPALGPQECVGESAVGDAAAPLRVYYSDGRHVALGVAQLALESLNGTVPALRGATLDVRQYLPPDADAGIDAGGIDAEEAAHGGTGCCSRVYWAVHPVFGVFYRLRIPLAAQQHGELGGNARRSASLTSSAGGVRTVCFRKAWAASTPTLHPLTATAGRVVGPLVRSLGTHAGEAAWGTALMQSLQRKGVAEAKATVQMEEAMAEHGAQCALSQEAPSTTSNADTPAQSEVKRGRQLSDSTSSSSSDTTASKTSKQAPRSHMPDSDPLIVALPARMRRLHLLPALLRSLSVAARSHRAEDARLPSSVSSSGAPVEPHVPSRAAHSDVHVVIVPIDMSDSRDTASTGTVADKQSDTAAASTSPKQNGPGRRLKMKEGGQQVAEVPESPLSGHVLGPSEALQRIRVLAAATQKFTGLSVEVALPEAYGDSSRTWEESHLDALSSMFSSSRSGGGEGSGSAAKETAEGLDVTGLGAAQSASMAPATLRRLVGEWTGRDGAAEEEALPSDQASLGPSAAALLCSPTVRVLVTALQAAARPGSHVLMLDGASLSVSRSATRLASWGVVARAQAVVALPTKLSRSSDGASLTESLTRWASSAVDRTVSPLLHTLSDAFGWHDTAINSTTRASGSGGESDSGGIWRPYNGPVDGGLSDPSLADAEHTAIPEWATEQFWATVLPDNEAEKAAALHDSVQSSEGHKTDAADTHPTADGHPLTGSATVADAVNAAAAKAGSGTGVRLLELDSVNPSTDGKRTDEKRMQLHELLSQAASKKGNSAVDGKAPDAFGDDHLMNRYQADDDVHEEEQLDSGQYPDLTIDELLSHPDNDRVTSQSSADTPATPGQHSAKDEEDEEDEEEDSRGRGSERLASLVNAVSDRPTTLAATRHDLALALWAALVAAHAADQEAASSASQSPSSSSSAAAGDVHVMQGHIGIAPASSLKVPAGRASRGSAVIGGWVTDEETLTARLLSGLSPVSDSCVSQRLVWGLRHGAGVRVPAVTMTSVLLDDSSLPRAIVPGMPAELWMKTDGSADTTRQGKALRQSKAAAMAAQDTTGPKGANSRRRLSQLPRRATLPEPEAEPCECAASSHHATSVPEGVLVVDGGCGWLPRHAVVDSLLDRKRVVCSVGRWVAASAMRAALNASSSQALGSAPSPRLAASIDWATHLNALLSSSSAGWHAEEAGPGAGLPLIDRRTCRAHDHIGHTIRRFHPARGLEIVFRPSSALMTNLEEAGVEDAEAKSSMVAAGQRDHHGAVMLLRIGFAHGGMSA